MYRCWLLIVALGCPLGCDPASSDDDLGAEAGAGFGEDGEDGEGGEADGSDGGGGPEALRLEDGWMQPVGPDQGAWIEAADAVLPEGCGGTLSAAEGSGGLALLAASPAGGEGEAEPKRLFSAADLTARPGAGEVSPIYAVSVTGEVTHGADGAEYPRAVALQDLGFDELVYLDVCETAAQRGQCFTPTPAFSFPGCIEVPTEAPSFIHDDPVVTADAGQYALTVDSGILCDHDVVLQAHPPEWPVGAQEIAIDAGVLPEGVPVAITAEMLTWRSSYPADVICETIEDLGETCTCQWSYREGLQIERGSIVRDGDTVHIDLKGAVGEESYLLWGRFGLRD